MSDEKALVTRALAPLRTFEAIIAVSGPLNGGLTDWPAHIQDAILDAAQRTENLHGLHLDVHHAVCEHDPDGWFLRVGLIENRDAGIRLENGDLLKWGDLK